MSHEQSETIQDPDTGKWVNVYGRKTPKAGQRLPNDRDYDTVEEAVAAAAARSKAYVEPAIGKIHAKPPRARRGVR